MYQAASERYATEFLKGTGLTLPDFSGEELTLAEKIAMRDDFADGLQRALGTTLSDKYGTPHQDSGRRSIARRATDAFWSKVQVYTRGIPGMFTGSHSTASGQEAVRGLQRVLSAYREMNTDEGLAELAQREGTRYTRTWLTADEVGTIAQRDIRSKDARAIVGYLAGITVAAQYTEDGERYGLTAPITQTTEPEGEEARGRTDPVVPYTPPTDDEPEVVEVLAELTEPDGELPTERSRVVPPIVPVTDDQVLEPEATAPAYRTRVVPPIAPATDDQVLEPEATAPAYRTRVVPPIAPATDDQVLEPEATAPAYRTRVVPPIAPATDDQVLEPEATAPAYRTRVDPPIAPATDDQVLEPEATAPTYRTRVDPPIAPATDDQVLEPQANQPTQRGTPVPTVTPPADAYTVTTEPEANEPTQRGTPVPTVTPTTDAYTATTEPEANEPTQRGTPVPTVAPTTDAYTATTEPEANEPRERLETTVTITPPTDAQRYEPDHLYIAPPPEGAVSSKRRAQVAAIAPTDDYRLGAHRSQEMAERVVYRPNQQPYTNLEVRLTDNLPDNDLDFDPLEGLEDEEEGDFDEQPLEEIVQDNPQNLPQDPQQPVHQVQDDGTYDINGLTTADCLYGSHSDGWFGGWRRVWETYKPGLTARTLMRDTAIFTAPIVGTFSYATLGSAALGLAAGVAIAIPAFAAYKAVEFVRAPAMAATVYAAQDFVEDHDLGQLIGSVGATALASGIASAGELVTDAPDCSAANVIGVSLGITSLVGISEGTHYAIKKIDNNFDDTGLTRFLTGSLFAIGGTADYMLGLMPLIGVGVSAYTGDLNTHRGIPGLFETEFPHIDWPWGPDNPNPDPDTPNPDPNPNPNPNPNPGRDGYLVFNNGDQAAQTYKHHCTPLFAEAGHERGLIDSGLGDGQGKVAFGVVGPGDFSAGRDSHDAGLTFADTKIMVEHYGNDGSQYRTLVDIANDGSFTLPSEFVAFGTEDVQVTWVNIAGEHEGALNDGENTMYCLEALASVTHKDGDLRIEAESTYDGCMEIEHCNGSGRGNTTTTQPVQFEDGLPADVVLAVASGPGYNGLRAEAASGATEISAAQVATATAQHGLVPSGSANANNIPTMGPAVIEHQGTTTNDPATQQPAQGTANAQQAAQQPNQGANGGAAAAAVDTDRDGLTDVEEAAYGTNPHTNDTDGDGFTDRLELESGTNPSDNRSSPTGMPDAHATPAPAVSSYTPIAPTLDTGLSAEEIEALLREYDDYDQLEALYAQYRVA